MKRRDLTLLTGAAGASVAAALLFAPRSADRDELSGGRGALAFEGLAARLAAARRIELRKVDATLVILNTNDRWVLPAKAGYPAKPDRVRELLVALTELRLAEPRTADRAQLGRLGLDDPRTPGSTAVLLRVLDAAEAPIAELVIGRRRVRTQGNVPEDVYVRRPAETQSWLAEGRLQVDTDPQLWLDREIVNLSMDRVRRVAVRRVNETPLALAKAGEPEARMRLVDPPDPPSTDEVALDEVGRAFEFLTFLDVKPAADIPGQALGEGRFELTDNLAVAAFPSRDADNLWVRLVAEGDAEAAALNARWGGWAFQVGIWKEKAFVPRLDDLLGHPPPAAPATPPGAGPAAPPATGPAAPPAAGPASPPATGPAAPPPAGPAAPPAAPPAGGPATGPVAPPPAAGPPPTPPAR